MSSAVPQTYNNGMANKKKKRRRREEFEAKIMHTLMHTHLHIYNPLFPISLLWTKFLIANGPDINTRSSLTVALQGGHTACVALLLQSKLTQADRHYHCRGESDSEVCGINNGDAMATMVVVTIAISSALQNVVSP